MRAAGSNCGGASATSVREYGTWSTARVNGRRWLNCAAASDVDRFRQWQTMSNQSRSEGRPNDDALSMRTRSSSARVTHAHLYTAPHPFDSSRTLVPRSLTCNPCDEVSRTRRVCHARGSSHDRRGNPPLPHGLCHSVEPGTLRQVSARHTRHHAPHHSHRTCPHSCSTRRCYSRCRRCTLRRVVNFLPRRPFFDFITLYLHHSCSDPTAEHIVAISMRHRTYVCNSILVGALLLMLQSRLCNFPAFSLIFPHTHLLATPSFPHRSQ
jgi:hypothetical protein